MPARRAKLALFLTLMACALGAWTAERTVATITDPTGDDNGDGTLVYPQRGDFQRGDLDLVALRVNRVDNDYQFEATFRNPVRDPTGVPTDTGGSESLAQFARRGFYTFNLDIYIDLDRLRGFGNTFTLPGRKVGIDAAFAWERALVLTPRPELMRQQLIDALVESEAGARREDVTARVDRCVLFVNRVRVRNRSVSFLVPAAFLADGKPDTDWAVTAFVTGAKTFIEADLRLFNTKGSALERLVLGVMQPGEGRPRDTFGYTGDRAPSPVVDVLAPAARDRPQLSGARVLSGVTWSAAGARGADALPDSSSTGADAAASADPASTDALRRFFAAADKAARPAAPATPVPAPERTPDSAPAATKPPVAADKPAAQAPAAASPAESKPIPRSIAERLQALKQLYDQKVIDEAEYKEQRQRILKEL